MIQMQANVQAGWYNIQEQGGFPPQDLNCHIEGRSLGHVCTTEICQSHKVHI